MSYDLVRDALPALNIKVEDVHRLYLDEKYFNHLQHDPALVGEEYLDVEFKDGHSGVYHLAQQPEGNHIWKTVYHSSDYEDGIPQ